MAKLGFGATFKLHNGTALVAVGEVTEVKPPNLEGSTVDTTHHGSVGGIHEYIPGLLDTSDIEIKINLTPGDASHLLLVAQVAARAVRAFELTIPTTAGNWKYSANCIPMSFEVDAPMEDQITGTFKAKVTGAITEAAAA